jgi:hypothetical protein
MLLSARFTKAYSREWLEAELRRALREGDLTIAEKAVAAADKGDEIADAALRDVGAELQMPLLQRRDLACGHLQVIAYVQRVLRNPSHQRGPGRGWADDWSRNLTVAVLIAVTCTEFAVAPTRNRESRRADREPSGCSLVRAALARHKIRLSEATLQRHIWLGGPGALVRQALARAAELGIVPCDNKSGD